MAKISSETLLRGNYLPLQKCSTELENLAIPNHLQLGLFVPPIPGSAPELVCMFRQKHYSGATLFFDVVCAGSPVIIMLRKVSKEV